MNFKKRNLLIKIYYGLWFVSLFTMPNFASAEQNPTTYVYVTDIDDTIKISNIKDKESAAWNGIFTRKAFSGMPILFRQFDKTASDHKIIYMSGTGTYLSWAVHSFLEKNDFPVFQVYLKKKLFQNVYDFKVKTLENILQTLADHEKLILIGDDTERDFEAYETIQKAHPEKVAHIYIHQVTGHGIPKNQTAFVTAFDIAKNEFINNRLSLESTLSVGMGIMIEKKSDKILPDFMVCDYKSNIPNSNEESIELLTKSISNKLKTICESR